MKHLPPIGEIEGKKQDVEAMFDAIAPRYDLLNRVLSMGIDKGWRKKTIAMLQEHNPQHILDVATGTADLAIQAYETSPDRIVGVDISEEMLKIGRQKIERLGLNEFISLQRGDAEALPFEDATFDAVLVAFGVRNFEDLRKGLTEIRRVLKRSGVLLVLEFSQPTLFPIKQAYNFYGKHILPRIGSKISKDEGAYTYLPESIKAFPHGKAFIEVMHDCGFKGGRDRKLTFGIASIYKGIAT